MTPEPLQPVPPAPNGSGSNEVREQDKIMLVLAYLGLLALIPLLTVKDSPYVKYHAGQGFTLTLVSFAVALVMSVIPVIGWLALCPLFLAVLVVNIVGIMKALKGERWAIPGVSDLSQKMFGGA
ncbi:MAG: DUF4870 domain-containing protein [Myxococcaceae bacterium]|nr:DUF4870 domain-containing protein [Myxococcaceae bacterium]